MKEWGWQRTCPATSGLFQSGGEGASTVSWSPSRRKFFAKDNVPYWVLFKTLWQTMDLHIVEARSGSLGRASLTWGVSFTALCSSSSHAPSVWARLCLLEKTQLSERHLKTHWVVLVRFWFFYQYIYTYIQYCIYIYTIFAGYANMFEFILWVLPSYTVH